MNITLPHEQAPNPYITPELCFQFDYFALRNLQVASGSQLIRLGDCVVGAEVADVSTE